MYYKRLISLFSSLITLKLQVAKLLSDMFFYSMLLMLLSIKARFIFLNSKIYVFTAMTVTDT